MNFQDTRLTQTLCLRHFNTNHEFQVRDFGNRLRRNRGRHNVPDDGTDPDTPTFERAPLARIDFTPGAYEDGDGLRR